MPETVKNPSTTQETQVRSPGREDAWGRKWQPTPALLPGKSWTEEPGRLQSTGLQRVRYKLATKQQQQHTHIQKYYSAIKKNEFSPFVAIWMDVEGIMLSEIIKTEISYGITYMCVLKK